MGTPVAMPSGSFPNKLWFYRGSYAVSTSTVEQPFCADTEGSFGGYDLYQPIPPKIAVQVSGEDFSYDDLAPYRTALASPFPQATVTTLQGKSYTGRIASYQEAASQDGTADLFSVNMTLEYFVGEDLGSE